MKPIKDNTVRKLFIRLFNKLYANKEILKSYIKNIEYMGEARTSNQKVKVIDAQIEELLNEERALFMVSEKGYLANDMLVISHSDIIGKIVRLKKERNNVLAELDGQDIRSSISKEFLELIEKRSMPMTIFEEDIFEKMVNKIIVPTRDKLVFHLKNGMELVETYIVMRGNDCV